MLIINGHMPVLKGRFSVYVYQSESDIFLNTSNPKFSVENKQTGQK